MHNLWLILVIIIIVIIICQSNATIAGATETRHTIPLRQHPGQHIQGIKALLDVIISEIKEGVHIFDKSKPTCLATDWSKQGTGFCLFQKHCNCNSDEPICCHTGWKITLVGSCFSHAAEQCYAPVEGEALTVADALDKACFFILGCTNLDHKPLLKIFGDRSLNEVSNARLCNLKKTL